MTPGNWTFLLAVLFSALLDVSANLLLVKSQGFSRRGYGISALLLVGGAFTCLAYAVRGMDLSVAYALWGGFGIFGTSLAGWALFGQRLRAGAWLGMAFLVAGMALLRFS